MIRPTINLLSICFGLVAALTACAPKQGAIRAETQAVANPCSAFCKTTCQPKEWPQWVCDDLPLGDNDPMCWERQDLVGHEFKLLVQNCDAARNNCLNCAKNPEAAGVTCGNDRPCQ